MAGKWVGRLPGMLASAAKEVHRYDGTARVSGEDELGLRAILVIVPDVAVEVLSLPRISLVPVYQA